MTNTRKLSRLLGFALLTGSLALTGCDLNDLLEVDDTETLDEDEILNPDVAAAAVTGAIGEFVNAYAGDGGDAYISVSALMSDEFFSSGTFTTRTATDRRNQFPIASGNTSDGTYNDLQFARRALSDAAELVAQASGTDDTQYAETRALEALTYVTLAEGFCSAVPISSVDDEGEFDYGAPQTSAQLLETAVALTDDALAGVPDNNLAALVKARALLALERYDEAAAAVAGVPDFFVYSTQHSETAQNNPIYSLQGNGRYSQSNNEGINGAPFRTGGAVCPWQTDEGVSAVGCDPRTPFYGIEGGGFDGSYDLYWSTKFWGFEEPVPIATGIEARLIEAEAALQDDDIPGMVTILNDLRDQTFDLMFNMIPRYTEWMTAADAATLENDDLDATGMTAAEAREVLFTERGFWMFASGHRLGDLRRLVANYGLDQDEVYPTGAYHKGGDFGDDVVMPVDFDEENNPNYSSDMCNVDSAAFN